MLYRCLECGQIFDGDDIRHVSDYMGEAWGAPAYRSYEGSPCCEADFVEAKQCKICGSYEGLEENEDYCKECKKDISIRLDKLLDHIKTEYKDEFEEAEREYLSECDYDWGALDGALVAAVEDEKNA